jgi:hypothetical protein
MTLVLVPMKPEQTRQEGVNLPVPKTQVVLSLLGQKIQEVPRMPVQELMMQVAQSLLED